MSKNETEQEDLLKQFEAFLEAEGLNKKKETKYVIDGGLGKVIKDQAKDAQYTIRFENSLFLQGKAIAHFDPNMTFNKLVNQGLAMIIKHYIKINGTKFIEGVMEENSKMNKEVFLKNRQKLADNPERRKQEGKGGKK